MTFTRTPHGAAPGHDHMSDKQFERRERESAIVTAAVDRPIFHGTHLQTECHSRPSGATTVKFAHTLRKERDLHTCTHPEFYMGCRGNHAHAACCNKGTREQLLRASSLTKAPASLITQANACTSAPGTGTP